jgi:hypothetical protein
LVVKTASVHRETAEVAALVTHEGTIEAAQHRK